MLYGNVDRLIYTKNTFATLTNIAAISNMGNNELLTLQSTLTNANGYNPISVTTRMEDYIISDEPPVTFCTTNTQDGILNQTCEVSANDFGNAQYLLDNTNYAGAYLFNKHRGYTEEP